MAGTTAHEPHGLEIRMPVHQEIAVRRVLLLAAASLDERRSRQCRKPSREVLARDRQSFLRRAAFAVIWVERWPMPVASNLKSARFQVRHSVHLVRQAKPGWHGRRRKSCIAGWRAKEEDLLPCHKNSAAQQVLEQPPYPRPATKYELPRPNFASGLRNQLA